ncbi:ABC transporter substrate binding protein [Rickettsia tamurae subsp. buchneri]|uniref:ABC transporter substrate binding protein n=1 Tax=Rickettsia tamurae subsp. buchneri TaxID=1462938 RepID=A0A8E0WMZ8_9RICK|nr:ABC transporter substrate-binding protein [Rickettsia endosymbiont of Ixodes scapularis]KDO03643.1 ABC transporter substrate binding protein [Rickettsia tamurae subsp. buchneri]
MLKLYTGNNNISLHTLMIQNLNDMPVAVKNVPENTQSFIILKDHLIVSGINILNASFVFKKSLNS